MQRNYRNPRPCAGKIFGLSIIFILLTVIPWLLVSLRGLNAVFFDESLLLSASIIMMSCLIILATMDLADKQIPSVVEWLLTFLMIAAVTCWSLSLIDGNTFMECIVLLVSVILFMVILSALGAKCPLDLIVIYASFLLIWWFVSLGLAIVILCLIFAAEKHTLAIYLFAFTVYPFLLSFVIYTGMLISSGRFNGNSLTQCVAPARSVYFHFVMLYLVTLMVWRESQGVGGYPKGN
ncbi:uncharacterized protein LOC131997768 [Stomoxys calcitrans]|uniref:uncharacterized protein LOC131997768 n=1 Tax=Stomoxys calcitrans TaxID=35570 RepID=UPI0027E254F1|nr:uncharacterized protein LOC131997768 [Stomoxys calcitrans]